MVRSSDAVKRPDDLGHDLLPVIINATNIARRASKHTDER
jgi:hypothetical protein